METKQQKEDLEAWVQDLTGFKSQLLHLQAVGLQCGNSLKFCEPSFLTCKTKIRKEQNWVWKTHFVAPTGERQQFKVSTSSLANFRTVSLLSKTASK